MATGIFKIDFDKCTENTLINFIRANTHKRGLNSYQLNKNVEDHSDLEKIVYRMAQHDISYMKNDNIDNFKVTFFTKCYKTNGNDVNMHVDFDDLDFIKNGKETMHPVMSSVTYLSISSNPTIITNITGDDIYDSNDINNRDIHAWESKHKNYDLKKLKYFAPLVNYKKQREKSLKLYSF